MLFLWLVDLIRVFLLFFAADRVNSQYTMRNTSKCSSKQNFICSNRPTHRTGEIRTNRTSRTCGWMECLPVVRRRWTSARRRTSPCHINIPTRRQGKARKRSISSRSINHDQSVAKTFLLSLVSPWGSSVTLYFNHFLPIFRFFLDFDRKTRRKRHRTPTESFFLPIERRRKNEEKTHSVPFQRIACVFPSSRCCSLNVFEPSRSYV